jgi:hypothetical protein
MARANFSASIDSSNRVEHVARLSGHGWYNCGVVRIAAERDYLRA